MPHPPTIPEGLDLVQMADGVTIRRNWRTPALIPAAIFALFWDGFLVFWYSTALSKPHPQLMVVVFPLIHVAVGVGITYFVVCSLFNNTDVIVTLSGVQVSIYPMPWPGNRRIGAEEITDVVVRQRNAYNNNFNNSRNRPSFAVMYAGASRKECKLLAYSQPDQAEYVASAIRAALNLAPPDP